MSPHRHSSQDASGASGADPNTDQGWMCCAPKGCLMGPDNCTISPDDLSEVTRLECSNELCKQSPFMHNLCFESFEESVLGYLKACGRARSWSDKQRLQNLWTKRGYDLVYKACECPCGHGHIKKDLSWSPPPPSVEGAEGGAMQQSRRKRKKSKNQSNRPTITIGLPTFNANGSQQQNSSSIRRSDAQNVPPHSTRNRTNSLSSNTSGSSFSSSLEEHHFPGSFGDHSQPPRRVLLQDRSRHDSGSSIFSRRLDYSSFNVLPKHKINSYHIKMEDECSIGNDETRIFILSNLASNKMNRVPCVLCKNPMAVFDRYPLIDGTFFLSPRQHHKSCVQVKSEGKCQYLTSVCMACLEGWNSHISCRYCFKSWSGSHLILGTMYSYDIFAAMPCCPERLKCNSCGQLVIHPDQRFNFFSDYSQNVSCPSCGNQDAHFVKNLSCFIRREHEPPLPSNMVAGGGGGALRTQRVNSA